MVTKRSVVSLRNDELVRQMMPDISNTLRIRYAEKHTRGGAPLATLTAHSTQLYEILFYNQES